MGKTRNYPTHAFCITTEQTARLNELSRVHGINKSELLRAILDESLEAVAQRFIQKEKKVGKQGVPEQGSQDLSADAAGNPADGGWSDWDEAGG